MKKVIVVLLIALIASSAVFAQGAQESTTKDSYEVVILVKSMGNGFFDACFEGSKQAAEELGNVTTTYMGPVQTTAEGQIEIIETLIAQRVDGIAISANDADALIPVTKKQWQLESK